MVVEHPIDNNDTNYDSNILSQDDVYSPSWYRSCLFGHDRLYSLYFNYDNGWTFLVMCFCFLIVLPIEIIIRISLSLLYFFIWQIIMGTYCAFSMLAYSLVDIARWYYLHICNIYRTTSRTENIGTKLKAMIYIFCPILLTLITIIVTICISLFCMIAGYTSQFEQYFVNLLNRQYCGRDMKIREQWSDYWNDYNDYLYEHIENFGMIRYDNMPFYDFNPLQLCVYLIIIIISSLIITFNMCIVLLIACIPLYIRFGYKIYQYNKYTMFYYIICTPIIIITMPLIIFLCSIIFAIITSINAALYSNYHNSIIYYYSYVKIMMIYSVSQITSYIGFNLCSTYRHHELLTDGLLRINFDVFFLLFGNDLCLDMDVQV